MKEIQLTQGKIALVDDEDYDFLNQFKWHYSNGYASKSHGKRPNRKKLTMHTLLLGAKEGFMIDHKNRNTLDNQKENLRHVTNSQNQMNAKKSKKNGVSLSQYKGVTVNKPFRATIGRKTIGYFDTELEAAQAYDKFAKALYGEFANLNFK